MTGNVINNKSILGFNLQKYLFRYRVTNITNPCVDLLYSPHKKKQKKNSIFWSFVQNV